MSFAAHSYIGADVAPTHWWQILESPSHFANVALWPTTSLEVKQLNQHDEYFYSAFIVYSPLEDKTQPTVRPICAAVSMVLGNKSQVMAPPDGWILEYESWPWSFIIHVFIMHSTSQCSLFIYSSNGSSIIPTCSTPPKTKGWNPK